MASVGVSMTVDDRVMLEAVGGLALSGVKAANRRAVIKTARLGASELKAFTGLAMFNNPGGYDPFSPANFRRPRVRSTTGSVSAGTGYTRAGSFDRFRSTGTGRRFRKRGGYTGTERGFGMVQSTARSVDPLFPAISDAEMVAEVKKRGL